MAKKKATTSNNSDTSKKAPAGKAVVKKTVAKKAISRDPAAKNPSENGKAGSATSKSNVQRVLSCEDIGHIAGEVWSLLAEQNGQTLAVLKKKISAPEPVIMAAVGWLAREGKLDFAVSGRATKVSLR